MSRTPQRRKHPAPALTPERDRATQAAYRVFELSPDGQAVLADLCESYYDRVSFAPDPYTTAFNEGQRSVVAAIFAILDDLKSEKHDTRG